MRTRNCFAVVVIALALGCTTSASAQDDVYARINPLEREVTGGNATRAQQLDLERLYIQVGRYYEAGKLAKVLLAKDASDAEAAAVRDEAQRSSRAAGEKKIADAEARARASDATDQDRLARADADFDAGSSGSAADCCARLPPCTHTRGRQ